GPGLALMNGELLFHRTQRQSPQSCRQEQGQAQPDRKGRGSHAEVQRHASKIAAGRNGQHAQAIVSAEYTASEAILGVELQQRARKDPVVGRSRVGQRHTKYRENERGHRSEQDVAGGTDQKTDKDSDSEPRLSMLRPFAADEWPDKSARSASAH